MIHYSLEELKHQLLNKKIYTASVILEHLKKERRISREAVRFFKERISLMKKENAHYCRKNDANGIPIHNLKELSISGNRVLPKIIDSELDPAWPFNIQIRNMLLHR